MQSNLFFVNSNHYPDKVLCFNKLQCKHIILVYIKLRCAKTHLNRPNLNEINMIQHILGDRLSPRKLYSYYPTVVVWETIIIKDMCVHAGHLTWSNPVREQIRPQTEPKRQLMRQISFLIICTKTNPCHLCYFSWLVSSSPSHASLLFFTKPAGNDIYCSSFWAVVRAALYSAVLGAAQQKWGDFTLQRQHSSWIQPHLVGSLCRERTVCFHFSKIV